MRAATTWVIDQFRPAAADGLSARPRLSTCPACAAIIAAAKVEVPASASCGMRLEVLGASASSIAGLVSKLCHAQLRLARTLAADLRLPWQAARPARPAHPCESPAGIPDIRPALPCPAGAETR